MAGEHWKDEPEAQDFPAAESYLSLLVGPAAAGPDLPRLCARNERCSTMRRRTSCGPPACRCSPDDSEVVADLDKVKAGAKLSPVLLVWGMPLWVADGYHRVCASYHLGEKTWVPCRVVARTPKG